LTDIARAFRPGTEFFRQRTIGCRMAPSDSPRRFIDALENGSCPPRSTLVQWSTRCPFSSPRSALPLRHSRCTDMHWSTRRPRG
jgi:hypothetical protein